MNLDLLLAPLMQTAYVSPTEFSSKMSDIHRLTLPCPGVTEGWDFVPGGIVPGKAHPSPQPSDHGPGSKTIRIENYPVQ